MTRWRMITVGAFLLAFAAGVPVGWIFDPFDKPVDAGQYAPSWLNDSLALTSAQEEQMRAIWSKTAQKLESSDKSQVSREKDKDVIAILSPEQKAQYEEIMAGFRNRRDEIDGERRAHHKAAIEETKAILTDDQLEKFEELLAAQRERGRLPMFGGNRGGRGDRDKN